MKPLYMVIAYVVLLHFGPIANLIGLLPGRVAPITTLGHIMMVYLTARYFLHIRRTGMSRLDLAVTAFTVWSIASFVLYFQKDNPSEITAYAYGVHLYLMPTFGYFAIKMLTARDQMKALNFILWSNVFMLAAGLYLWWARPAFYTAFLRDVVFTNLEDWSEWMIYLRMQSYLASVTVGIICAITVAMLGALGSNAWKTILVLAIVIPSVFLCYQRGGQVGTLIALAYVVVWGKGSRLIRPLILAVSFVAAAAAFLVVMESSDLGLEYYLDRREDYNTRLLEGRRGYTVGWEYVSAFPLGVGLGGSGNAASSAGLTQWDKVVDGNFMRIFADLGVEGILMFLIVIGLSIEAAIRKRKNGGIACIIIIFCVIALGSTVWDSHLTPQLFWLILGMADTREEAPAPETIRADVPIAEPPGMPLLEPAAQTNPRV